MSPTPPPLSQPTRTTVRSCAGRLLGATVALTFLSTALLTAPPAVADTAVTAKAGSFTVRGSGFGHGHGMSQWGAYGAARKGLGWQKILAFYYPGTKLTTMPSGTKIKVWLTADSDSNLRVAPAAGLKVSDASGNSYCLLYTSPSPRD